jgi:hypothetical protein
VPVFGITGADNKRMSQNYLLKVSRSGNKIVKPKLLPKNEQTNLFFFPEK